jgi:hypothetical protein
MRSASDPAQAALRQAAVAEALRQSGGALSRAAVEQLAKSLGCSVATVRRDQEALRKGAKPGARVVPPPPRRAEVFVLPSPAPPPPSPRPADVEPEVSDSHTQAIIGLSIDEALAHLAGLALRWSDSPRGDWALRGIGVAADLLERRAAIRMRRGDAEEDDLDPEAQVAALAEIIESLPPALRRRVLGAGG